MSATLTEKKVLKGGEFLVKNSSHMEMFIPEEFNEEQLMIKETVKTFVEQDIWPHTERIEKLEEGLIPSRLDIFACLRSTAGAIWIISPIHSSVKKLVHQVRFL